MVPHDDSSASDLQVDPASVDLPPTVAVTIDISELLQREANRQTKLNVEGLNSVAELVANPGIAPMLGMIARSLDSALGFLDVTHIRVLLLLCQRESISVAELAGVMKMRARTALRMLDSMDDAGWIFTMTPGRGTREVVAISAQGRALIEDVTAQRQREIDSILGRMVEDDRESLTSAFNAFADAAGEFPLRKPRKGIAP